MNIIFDGSLVHERVGLGSAGTIAMCGRARFGYVETARPVTCPRCIAVAAEIDNH